MTAIFFHPRGSSLMAFLDGDLAGKKRSRVADHLADCTRCRAEIVAVRSIESEAGRIAVPASPDNSFDRILARRAAGERVVLPRDDDGATAKVDHPTIHHTTQLISAALAASVLIAFAWLVVPRTDAAATASGGDLRFIGSLPRPGQVVRVSYSADPRFRQNVSSGSMRRADKLPAALVMRGEFREVNSEPYDRRTGADVATLTLGDDGRYHGSFAWPDSAVFGSFAVEDSTADIVDSNHRELWMRVAAGSAGRENESGLEQESNDLMGRDWSAAYTAARRRARLYPNSLKAWLSQIFFEQQVLGSEGSATADAANRTRFASIDARMRSSASVNGSDVEAMMWIGREVNDTVRTKYWRHRLLTDFPKRPRAVQERAVVIPGNKKDPHVALRELESLWDEVGPAHRNLMLTGLNTAEAAHDSVAVRKWGLRLMQPRPRGATNGDAGWVAAEFTQYPSLRAEGMSLLRDQIRRIEADDANVRRSDRAAPHRSSRSLLQTRSGQLRADSLSIQDRLMSIGVALTADSAYEAAIDTLELATVTGWSPRAFRDAAHFELIAGDTTAAIRQLARVLVDPAVSPSQADSLRATVGATHEAALAARLPIARGEMRTRVLADAVRHPINSDVRLKDDSGAERQLRDIAHGRVTLVAFWSRFCGPSIESMPQLDSTARALSALGVNTVAITDEAPSPAVNDFLREKGVALKPYYDARREAALALNAWGTPAYFVLDANGVVRFEYSDFDQVVAQAVALKD